MLLLDADQAFFLKAGKGPAYGFQLEAQIAADFLPGHAQVELGGGIAPGGKTLGKVEQEGGQPLFRPHGAQQHHDPVIPDNFPAHDLVEVVLEGNHFPGQTFQARVGDNADFAVFQGHRVTGVGFRADAVQPQQFPGHLKAGDLIPAVF